MSFISFVIPCYRSEKTIEKVIEEIRLTMSKHNDDFEIILTNDASPDNTLGKIRELADKYDNVTGIDMAKNFGQHAGLMAGMRESKGDIVVFLDDDCQTPADECYKLIDKLNEGYDVVYASYPEKKHSGFRNFGSLVNKKMTEYLLEKPKDLYISSYFAARRYVVDEMIKYANPYPYVIGLVLRTTGNITNVPVNHREREEGRSGYTFGKLMALWINGFTAFSVKPLRIATYMGLISAFFGLLYAIYAVINKFINPAAPLGWTSMIIILLVLGGMILAVLGLIGEYIGRIYISMNNSPQYVIRERIIGKNRSEQ